MASMDALKSFTTLTDNLPDWITKITDLAVHTAAKHAQFAADYAKLVEVKPRKQKTSSNHSIKPIVTGPNEPPQDPIADTAETPSKPQVQLSPLDPSYKYLFATPRRKRKNAGTSIRSGASGPQKFRSRHMVVVHYDSLVQDVFETLVRNIGGARNSLRKGKLSTVMKRGFQLPSLATATSRGEVFNFTVSDYKNGLRATRSNMGPKRPGLGSATAVETEESVFDRADKELEAAQSLCELAAHQFLRDGDCSLEIDGTRENLMVALEIAKAEVERLQEEEKLEKEMEDAETAVDEADGISTNGKVMEPQKVGGLSSSTIEVDDDSDASSIDIDITAFRSTRTPLRA